MKDSYEKDPFAEYDKYWDDLDKQEEKTKKKSHKEYHFDEQKPTPISYDQKKLIRTVMIGITAFIFVGIFFNLFVNIFNDGDTPFGSWMFPFMMSGSSFSFIFIIIVIMIIFKASKRD